MPRGTSRHEDRLLGYALIGNNAVPTFGPVNSDWDYLSEIC